MCFVGFHEPRAGFGWVAWLDAAPPTGRVYSGPDHLNIVSKSRGGLSSSKLRHISKMASIHLVKETIDNVKIERVREQEREREQERGFDLSFIAVLVCVLMDFMQPAQALRACCR